MKILKPGKVEMRKFVCPDCGCEFVIEGGVDIILWKHKEGWGKVPIVRCLCGKEIELHDGEPYEEPTQYTSTAKERLFKLLTFLVLNSTDASTVAEAEFLLRYFSRL